MSEYQCLGCQDDGCDPKDCRCDCHNPGIRFAPFPDNDEAFDNAENQEEVFHATRI